MRMTSWLDSFRAKTRRTPTRYISRRRRGSHAYRAAQPVACRLAMVERLEDRTLLSGTTTATLALQQGVNSYAGMTN